MQRLVEEEMVVVKHLSPLELEPLGKVQLCVSYIGPWAELGNHLDRCEPCDSHPWWHKSYIVRGPRLTDSGLAPWTWPDESMCSWALAAPCCPGLEGPPEVAPSEPEALQRSLR